MKRSIHISIPKPCHESWDRMDATAQGAFCHSCQKEVIDFSAMTDREVVEYLSNHQKGCGRFRNDQLDRKISIVKTGNGFMKWKALLMSILTLGGIKTTLAALPIRPSVVLSDKDTRTVFLADSTLQSVTLSGHITCTYGAIARYALVEVVDSSGKNILEAQADSSGYFKIVINKETTQRSPKSIMIHYEDCISKTIVLTNEANQEFEVVLSRACLIYTKGRF